MSPRRYRSVKRKQAVEETRRRIVEATVQLHAEHGVRATSWEDIAQRAQVALATVYRHYRSLDALVTACGDLTNDLISPPTLDDVPSTFAGAQLPADRIACLVNTFAAFYLRAQAVFTTVYRERHAVPQLDAWLAEQDAVRHAFVEEALRPLNVDPEMVSLTMALTAFPTWQAFVDQGVEHDRARATIVNLMLRAFPDSKDGEKREG
jgi:AcrR family transcriptional regulator